MKKLLAIFTLLVLSYSCTKEVDISQDEASSESVKFTASVVDVTQTKATLINSWSGGEEIALFVEDDDKLYHFTIAEDGTMKGDDVIIEKNVEHTYIAYYPYDENLETVGAYEAASANGDVDYMKAETTTTGTAVNLQFEHRLVALSFSIIVPRDETDPAISIAIDGDFSNGDVLDVEKEEIFSVSILKASYFVQDGTNISSAVIKVEHSGTTTFLALKRAESFNDEANILFAGKEYPFSFGEYHTGTVDDPFVVYTAEEMRRVGTGIDGFNLDSHYRLVMDIDLGGIDAEGNGIASKEFTAIGSENNPFKGTFDGGGHKISGLYINETGNYLGLFGCISNATIENLGVSGSVEGLEYIGGVVGFSINSPVTNCYNVGSVEGLGEDLDYIGGVVGGLLVYWTVKYACYDKEVVTGVTGAINGKDDGLDLCGLTIAMMKGAAETEGSLLYYFSQDGSTEWVADIENINNGYPILLWQRTNE